MRRSGPLIAATITCAAAANLLPLERLSLNPVPPLTACTFVGIMVGLVGVPGESMLPARLVGAATVATDVRGVRWSNVA